MQIIKGLCVFGLFSWVAISGCAGSNDNSADLSQLTPAELCQKKCDLQIAANCSNAAADFATSCAPLCGEVSKISELRDAGERFGCVWRSARELHLCVGDDQRDA
jgi:hypothetical protein